MKTLKEFLLTESFKEFLLTESFKNLFFKDKAERERLGEEAFALLQKAYERLGGIQGKGFTDVNDMIQNIPFWKLNIKDGKINALVMYKDSNGRKSVAAATDFTTAGKNKLKEIIKGDMKDKRAFGEKSDPMLKFVKTNFPDLVKKFAIPAKEAIKILTKGKPEKLDKFRLIKGEKFMYDRLLKDGWHPKMLIGTPGNTIIQ